MTEQISRMSECDIWETAWSLALICRSTYKSVMPSAHCPAYIMTLGLQLGLDLRVICVHDLTCIMGPKQLETWKSTHRLMTGL